MSAVSSHWDISTQLTDKETAILERAAAKITQSVFDRTTNKKDRRILLFGAASGAFAYAVSFAAIDVANKLDKLE